MEHRSRTRLCWQPDLLREVSELNSTLKYLLLALLAAVPVGVTIRIVVCLLRMQTDPEQESLYRRQAINAAVYAVIAECALSVLTMVYNYLS